MPADVMNVANYLIKKGIEDDNPVTSTKLQKLLYYAQGYWMGLNGGQSLFERELKKLPHGPVCVYVLKRFRRQVGPIIELHPEGQPDRLTREEASHLDKIWRTFGQYSAYQLSDRSHRELPWMETPTHETISTRLIYHYFSELLELNKAKKMAGKA